MSATLVQTDVETRSGEGFQVADVNFPKRIVTVIAMPYERPAEVFHGDRVVTEICNRTAFAGIEKRAGRIRANRDHDWGRLAGKIVALHPSRSEGLVTEIRMFDTVIGEETLRLCDEGGLDASAGFALLRRDDGRIYEDAEIWERSGTIRRLNRLHLDHVALVPNPAYQDATVLDVRTQQERPYGDPAAESTPNLDRLALDRLRAQAAELDRRWPHQ